MKTIQYILTVLITTTSLAQVSKSSDLYHQMKTLDSIVFEVGFNNCNLAPTEAILTSDFEFYHDLGGIQDKQTFLQAMEKNICGNTNVDISRKLILDSMEVFPLKNNNKLYGSYVTGEHEFFQQPNGQNKKKTGYAKFTSYYELQNNAWKLKRVFSYDHKAVN